MLNKHCTSVIQIACVLLFILVLASSTSANPVYKTDDSLSKKVVDFNVHISESGEEYNETIEVDTEKQTELFQVPAHPGVDRSDVLNDFKQKLTMIRIPDKNICYLMPLPKEQTTPEKLIRDLEKAEQEVITKVRRIDSTWILERELNERSFLSDELQQFCTDYPIYLVKKTQDSLAVTATKTDAEIKIPKRRRSIPFGWNDYEYIHGIPDEPVECTRETTTCYKYVMCLPGSCRLPPSVLQSAYRVTRKQCCCWEIHELIKVVEKYVCGYSRVRQSFRSRAPESRAPGPREDPIML